MNKIQKEMVDNHIDELNEIDRVLTNVQNHSLGIEVVYTALKEMSANPSSSPLLCLQIAASDWDC